MLAPNLQGELFESWKGGANVLFCGLQFGGDKLFRV